MTKRFDRILRLGYGFSLLMLLTVGVICYLTLNNLLTANRAVSHSAQVMQNLEKLLSVMKDAETGQRGYLLTGRTNYLEPYNGAYREAISIAGQLESLVDDKTGQQKNIKLIQDVLRRRLDILQQLINKKKGGEIISDTDLDESKAAMDALRMAVAKAETDEQLQLHKHEVLLNRYANITPIFILLSMILAIGITAYSYRNVIKDISEKDKLRKALETREYETAALNEELTAANEEITAANEELIAINEELSEARVELAEINTLLEQRVASRTKALQDSEQETATLNEELTAINEEMAATNEELLTTNEELAESERRLQDMVDILRQADERSAKLAAIVESSDDAIIGKNLEGIVTSWNRGAEQIFGYDEDDIVGQSILMLIPSHLQHEEPLILARLRNGEKIDHYETIRQTKDGRLIDVSLTISPIRDSDGRVIGVSKIARDISEQKRDEQRKNDFIGMASHELKTPLTSLMALVQVVQLKLKDNNDPFIPQALSKASLQAKKMSSLINGFLNISRLESGKLEIIKNNFDLIELIGDELAEIRLTVSSHIFIFNGTEPIKITADRDKIGSVLSNLLSNAVKYSPKGKLINISVNTTDNMVELSIQDEGMGIKSIDLPRIFDRYYRVGTEHTNHISGFGVGLYLCAEIIQRHDGRIWAESEKGLGSTFYFTLPI